MRQGLALLSRQEYSNAVVAHHSLDLWDSSGPSASASQIPRTIGTSRHTWLIFVLLVEMRFHHVGHAGLKRLTSGDPPTSAFQGAGITGVNHCAQPEKLF